MIYAQRYNRTSLPVHAPVIQSERFASAFRLWMGELVNLVISAGLPITRRAFSDLFDRLHQVSRYISHNLKVVILMPSTGLFCR